MASALLTTVLLAQLVSPVSRAEVAAAAAASPRPSDCSSRTDGARRSGGRLWDLAKAPGLQGYCAALARGYARLRGDPSGALKAAADAERALGGRAGAAALRGRALLRLARAEEARTEFIRARSLDRHSLETPATLHDFATASLLAGRVQDAVEAYRALVPRAGLLVGPIRRQRAYVEAAAVVMQLGEPGLDEAIGYLNEARRQGSPPGYEAFVLGALALALDRQGHPQQARGVAAETPGPWGLARLVGTEPMDGEEGEHARAVTTSDVRLDGVVPVLPPGELNAIVAVLAEEDDSALAVEQWEAHLRTDPERRRAWSAHAAEKLRALSQPTGRRGGR